MRSFWVHARNIDTYKSIVILLGIEHQVPGVHQVLVHQLCTAFIENLHDQRAPRHDPHSFYGSTVPQHLIGDRVYIHIFRRREREGASSMGRFHWDVFQVAEVHEPHVYRAVPLQFKDLSTVPLLVIPVWGHARLTNTEGSPATVEMLLCSSSHVTRLFYYFLNKCYCWSYLSVNSKVVDFLLIWYLRELIVNN